MHDQHVNREIQIQRQLSVAAKTFSNFNCHLFREERLKIQVITRLLAKIELKRNCFHVSSVFGTPLGAYGKGQVSTALVKR